MRIEYRTKSPTDATLGCLAVFGACMAALGHDATGAVTNQDALQARVVKAGQRSGDIVWPLPNFPEYGGALKGQYANPRNSGPREGGAITGGLLPMNFVGETPWVHLDIAGTAWGVKRIGHIPNAGAAGVGAPVGGPGAALEAGGPDRPNRPAAARLTHLPLREDARHGTQGFGGG